MATRDIAQDRDYFLKRAKEERERAAVCEDNAAALVHLRLADEYDRQAVDPAMTPSPISN
ncbi:hypothetical protein AB2M62_03690 [Sphingomonas sp. MMS12-HWE2-04]|uniref:hypothetical protein n=1 Tax=Sphingomonas sp. MMS12-HWE2-04 TaxID=3234199 RepID=UPI00384EA982